MVSAIILHGIIAWN